MEPTTVGDWEVVVDKCNVLLLQLQMTCLCMVAAMTVCAVLGIVLFAVGIQHGSTLGGFMGAVIFIACIVAAVSYWPHFTDFSKDFKPLIDQMNKKDNGNWKLHSTVYKAFLPFTLVA